MYNKYDPIPAYLMDKIRIMSQCSEVREIPHFPLYAVTLNGQVWSVQPLNRDGKLPYIPRKMKPTKGKYSLVHEDRCLHTCAIARLLLMSFVSPPPFEGANAAYLDGDRDNISLDNLVWLSEEERASRSLKRNKASVQIKDYVIRKLTPEIVEQMKAEYVNGMTFAEIGHKYGVSAHSARFAVRGNSWKDNGGAVPLSVRNDATGSRHPKAKLTEDQVREIKRRLANGEQQKVIAKDYGVSPTSIRAIAIGRNWGHVT